MHKKTLSSCALILALALAACRGGEAGEAVPEASTATDTATPAPIHAQMAPDTQEVPEREQPRGSAGAEELASAPAPARRDGAGPQREAPAAERAPADADATAIMQRAERAYAGVRSMEADFVQEVHVPLLDQTQRSRGKLYHRRPDRFLMKFSQPEGDVVVADGRHLWMYYPSTDPKQVIRTSLAAGGQQVDLQKEFLSNSSARYHAVLTGTETVAGRPAHVLVLTPKTRSGYRQVRIWVDQGDSLVRRFEIIEENDSVRRLELRNLALNGTLPDQLFHFTPPPGAQVFEQ